MESESAAHLTVSTSNTSIMDSNALMDRMCLVLWVPNPVPYDGTCLLDFGAQTFIWNILVMHTAKRKSFYHWWDFERHKVREMERERWDLDRWIPQTDKQKQETVSCGANRAAGHIANAKFMSTLFNVYFTKNRLSTKLTWTVGNVPSHPIYTFGSDVD